MNTKTQIRVVAPHAVSSSKQTLWVIRDHSTVYFTGSDAQCNHHIAQYQRLFGNNLKIERL